MLHTTSIAAMSCRAGWPVAIWCGWIWRFHGIRAQKVYVQDRLRESAAQVRQWLAEGAAIYICGSLQGMAAGVDQALIDMLG